MRLDCCLDVFSDAHEVACLQLLFALSIACVNLAILSLVLAKVKYTSVRFDVFEVNNALVLQIRVHNGQNPSELFHDGLRDPILGKDIFHS